MSEFLSRNRIALGAVAVVVLVLAAGGGYYFTTLSGSAKRATLTASNVCEATITRAQSYGVLPPNAQKAEGKGEDEATPGRFHCGAQSAEASFSLVSDIACEDADKAECLMLKKVTKSDGTALYDTQDI